MKSNIHLYLASFINNGKYLFYKDGRGFVVMPAIGDIVEFGDKTRTIVVYSDITIDASGDANIEVYTLENDFEMLLNKRGRQYRSLSISSKDAEWPIPNTSLIRDGEVIYPVSLKFRATNNCRILFIRAKERLLTIKKLPSILTGVFENIKDRLLSFFK
jgi:hypothetical protein